MIVREILQAPLEVIGKFDHFNDFKDTMQFLESSNKLKPDILTVKIMEMLRAANDIWIMVVWNKKS